MPPNAKKLLVNVCVLCCVPRGLHSTRCVFNQHIQQLLCQGVLTWCFLCYRSFVGNATTLYWRCGCSFDISSSEEAVATWWFIDMSPSRNAVLVFIPLTNASSSHQSGWRTVDQWFALRVVYGLSTLPFAIHQTGEPCVRSGQTGG